MGFPGSGKSSFYHEVFAPMRYEHVNQDKLGNKGKCISTVETLLAAGRSVVVDNTNPGADTRAEYLAIAREHGVPVRCFWFGASRALAQQLNRYREKTGSAHKPVPVQGYNYYDGKFVEPTAREGFTAVVRVETRPRLRFVSDQQQRMFEEAGREAKPKGSSWWKHARGKR